ncbi:hypothetical protein A3K02_01985 [candidate division WS6 bacterium RIFOXYD1_FULL_33_8]|uniref:Haloacid dehalogenase domain protein hydrolase n=2 Tax=Candidatus Dojkabacteria TaxID=74243 RepID=A0A0G0AEP3_9BACT|nr:MAG: hypothetical protein UR32_C0006G0031 [candidate division WS6 bacterium GW2011_GWE2_33_157]KKP43961.1 MAG: hypothetical protein UR34_C0008G0020 [candidate division WS6 bacterium GW2011_GWC1_33_20]KKP45674.1 MAG: hypothetical protein UR36_C0005G0010 [candidate division WS6 bacterium GW2011_GWF1_33_233]KKP55065.1 MAG: hypothetical protein UR45_C0005G0018 [candidate division WS6 bacterium GW2011_WS6_33_547]KKP55234.1 MAG: hypothetical protein UR47_C0003G0010 [candidate division WS6 bacteriu
MEIESESLLQPKKFFLENNIHSVLFDMDSTLVDTSKYFKDEMVAASLLAVRAIPIKKSKYGQLQIAKEMYSHSVEIHRTLGYPLLVDVSTKLGIDKYIELNKIEFKEKKWVYEMIYDFFKDFYNVSPNIFPGTVEILHRINETGTPIGIYSHAQNEWTQKKVENIKSKYFEKYETDIELPYFTTSLENQKDSEGWKQASQYLSFNLENTLVVGDNFKADILPAINAGCKNLIHISSKSGAYDYKDVGNVHEAKNISEIFDNL